ncbi:uncharacterized protein LOC113464921 [Ceratina calcarata]|uniref:Uncharacterized protein LOC113464921 n=1 Tax=Ceratina calcarata TaxID=156304 RepID=A0AAJ7SA24_9HYME|nr:uncharacterized protein LOC113464921 [Ceratina calcarata]
MRVVSSASTSSAAYSDSRTNSGCSSQFVDDYNNASTSTSIGSSLQLSVAIATWNPQLSCNRRSSITSTDGSITECLCSLCAHSSEVLSSSTLCLSTSRVNSDRLISLSSNCSSSELVLSDACRGVQGLSSPSRSPLYAENRIEQHTESRAEDVTEYDELKRLISDAQKEIDRFQEELNTAQLQKEDIENQARQAEIKVKSYIEDAIAILEARELYLLAKNELFKRNETATLKSIYNTLENNKKNLYHLFDQLTGIFKIECPHANMFCLAIIHAMFAKCTEPIPYFYWEKDMDCIVNGEIEKNLVPIVGNFGEVVDTNPELLQISNDPCETQPMPILHKTMPKHIFPKEVRTLNSGEPVEPSVIIGTNDNDLYKLCRPWGVACDDEGHVVVSDRSNHRIQIFTLDGGFVRSFGTLGTDPGQFNRPAGVTVDSRKRIIVADKDNHRIQAFTMDGQFLFTFGKKGQETGQFNYPWDVAVNSQCQIVVSDTRNHRIQLFTKDGIYLRKYGHETNSKMWYLLDSPRGVAFNIDGEIVVTDFNNHKVLIINSSLSEIRVLQCDSAGSEKLFNRPQGVITDVLGNIIVADSKNHRIQVFNRHGFLIWKFGSYGSGITEMDRPSGIALTHDGRIVAVDFGNNRVLIF